MKNVAKLTSKEEEVMEMIWQLGACAPKDVLAIYPEPKPHINTVATMFQSLEKKGYLTHEAQGRGYVYIPLVKQQDYGKSKLHSFVGRYFENSYLNVVSTLVQEEKVSEQELLDFLNELKKNRK
ncbi:MAG: BlaI/MecI/CopY family transcriptional regulator [Bacteroidaceae bacterium]|nr:BlaI/MecI/CopY family transcriptional regulator [Bacteroidaceae bacterium]